MKVRQLSIFLENKEGRLAGVAKILGENAINIRALSVADTHDFGILRLLVDDIDKAEEKLREHNVVCRINNVTIVAVDNQPGGLAKVLETLHNSGVNIEYMYAVAEPNNDRPLLVFRFNDGQKAVDALQEAGCPILTEQQLFG